MKKKLKRLYTVAVSRLRCFSFLAVIGAVGDTWASYKGQNLVNHPLSSGSVRRVECEAHGPGLAPNQLITQSEDLGTTENPGVSMTVPNSVLDVVNAIHDQPVGTIWLVIEVPTNREHQGTESRISTLPLLPPRDYPSGGNANDGTYQTTENDGEGYHLLWWHWIFIGLIVLAATLSLGFRLCVRFGGGQLAGISPGTQAFTVNFQEGGRGTSASAPLGSPNSAIMTGSITQTTAGHKTAPEVRMTR